MSTISPILICVTIFEASLIAANLFLFSYGYPDVTRMASWEEGGINLFNSNPDLRIYFYANHLEPSEIPYVWSQSFTDFNLGVAILTFWVFFARSCLRCMGVNATGTELLLHNCVLPFWILSLSAQKSPDYSDDKHPSRVPWYLTHGCGLAQEKHESACRVAQASFALTIITTCFYACWIWRIVAYAGFDYMLHHFQIQVKVSSSRPSADKSEEMALEEGWSDDESPLMREWDDT